MWICAEAEVWSSHLVTNILLSFLTTHRADSKRFEMLSILSTILSWDDIEREKAGLQRVGGRGNGVKSPSSVEKGKRKDRQGERSAEEEAAMNEVRLTPCGVSGMSKWLTGNLVYSPFPTSLSSSSSKKPHKANPHPHHESRPI